MDSSVNKRIKFPWSLVIIFLAFNSSLQAGRIGHWGYIYTLIVPTNQAETTAYQIKTQTLDEAGSIIVNNYRLNFTLGQSTPIGHSCKIECGDINCDCDIRFTDVQYLAAYLFSGGPPPCDMWAADVNCDGEVNYQDLTILANYLFQGAPAPQCCPIR